MLEIVVPSTKKYPNVKPKVFCPIRFARYREEGTFGSPPRDWPLLHRNPPVDVHGNKAYGTAAVRGPVLGYGFPSSASADDRQFRVQLMRDVLSDKALLFPVLRDTSVVTLVSPAAGGSLPKPPGGLGYDVADDVIEMRANAVTSIHETVLDIHYQSTSGPLLGSLTIVIYPAIDIQVQVYAVTIDHPTSPIHHGPPQITPATVRSRFERVNHFYEQAGITFTFAQTDANGDPVFIPVNNHHPLIQSMYHMDGVVCTQHEMMHVSSLGNDPTCLNVYLVPAIHPGLNFIGYGNSRTAAEEYRVGAQARYQPTDPRRQFVPQPGIVLASELPDPPGSNENHILTHAIAHEIAHCLEVDHYDGGEPRPGIEQISHVRNDLWAHSNLMYPFATFPAGMDIVNGAPVLNVERLPAPPNNDPGLYCSGLRQRVGYGRTESATVFTLTLVHAGQMLCRKDRRRYPPSSGFGDQVNYLRTFAAAGWYRQYTGTLPASPLPRPPRQGNIQVGSNTFSPNFAPMPQRCANTPPPPNNVSPELHWSNLPPGTSSLAILCEDFDFGNTLHWACFDLPASVASVQEGLTPPPPSFLHGTNDFGTQGYIGPFPPAGTVHQYRFTLYALDVASLGLPAGASGSQVREALRQHTIATTGYMGTYP